MNSFWSWYVGGPLIALVMFLLLYFGKTFGISSSMRTLCSIGGAGKVADFFKFDWRSQVWNLLFVLGLMIGGWITHHWMPNENGLELSNNTLNALKELGLSLPAHDQLVPQDLISWEQLFTLRGFIIMIGGGFLVGFGSRYAGGCTSGHAISGLSNLQSQSLVAVIGFFIGGLFMTHVLFPMILSL